MAKNRKPKKHKRRNPIVRGLKEIRKKIFASAREYSRKRRKAANRDTAHWHKNDTFR